MPTFTAIALERLFEPGASESANKSVPSGRVPDSKPPNPRVERRTSKSTQEKKVSLPQLSPALYATPEAIPLPDSPSSFPPSPYIINHKGRGPRLSKSFSEDDVPSRRKALDEEAAMENPENGEVKGAKLKKSTSVTFCTPNQIEEPLDGNLGTSTGKGEVNGPHDSPVAAGHLKGAHGGKLGSKSLELGSGTQRPVSNQMSGSLKKENDLPKPIAVKSERESESEEFYDPRESMSFTSNSDGEDNYGAECSLRFSTPMAEFYDAWEELSSDSGLQTSVHKIEAELREMRLSLLMEIEKRKQAEESLNHIRSYWLKIREQLAQVGLTLPADPIIAAEGEQPCTDLAEKLGHQFHIARFVSESLGRGIAKAEVETELEAQIEAKNFEIARLSDRLHYYEVVNHEMSQRNQEAVEMTRRDRQRMKRRQRWVWGSIATFITLGTAALAWSYLPSGKISSSANSSAAFVGEDVSKKLSQSKKELRSHNHWQKHQ